MSDPLQLSNLKVGQYFKFENPRFSYSYICKLTSIVPSPSPPYETKICFVVTKSITNSLVRPVGYVVSIIIDGLIENPGLTGNHNGLNENFWSVVKKTDSNYPKCSLCK